MKRKLVTSDLLILKSILLIFWSSFFAQIIYSNLKSFDAQDHSTYTLGSTSDEVSRNQVQSSNNILTDQVNLIKTSPPVFGIIFAEAGKKKKKEKSEVVVISVNNPQKGHGGMYPIYIPTCGGGHGGYGRRKRSLF